MNDDSRIMTAGWYVKAMYLLGLVVIIYSFWRKVEFALLLLSRMGKNPNTINPILAIILIVTSLVVLVFLGMRCINIVRGKLELTAYVSNNWTLFLRMFGLVLLNAGVMITLLVLGSMCLVSGGGQILLAGYFSFSIPVGLVLFELSRLSEFEHKYEA